MLSSYHVDRILGIKIDAQTALDYLTSHPDLNKTRMVIRICLFRCSLLHYPRFFMANPLAALSQLIWQVGIQQKYISLSPPPKCYSSDLQIEALILENTFTSLPELVPHALPILGPFSFLCHQKWNSASKISLIPATTPILMLSGLQDEIVPKTHMLALWEAVARRGEQKKGNGSEFKVGLERAKYIEFEDGSHSEYF